MQFKARQHKFIMRLVLQAGFKLITHNDREAVFHFPGQPALVLRYYKAKGHNVWEIEDKRQEAVKQADKDEYITLISRKFGVL